MRLMVEFDCRSRIHSGDGNTVAVTVTFREMVWANTGETGKKENIKKNSKKNLPIAGYGQDLIAGWILQYTGGE